MSKPREKWCGYVRLILYAYTKMSSGPDRSRMEERERTAVAQALEECDPATRELVGLVFFERSHGLREAAAVQGISFGTARRMQGGFFRLVWRCLDEQRGNSENYRLYRP